MFRWTDLLWLLGYPVYQILGTIRHEGGHALAALLEGATIDKFVFWPNRDLGRFTWGYAQWTGSTSNFTLFAPYLVDLLTFAGGLALIWRWPPSRYKWLWINVVLLLLVSPLVNSLFNYLGGFGNPATDVARLLAAWPDGLVHLYFLITMAAYVVFLVWLGIRAARNRTLG